MKRIISISTVAAVFAIWGCSDKSEDAPAEMSDDSSPTGDGDDSSSTGDGDDYGPTNGDGDGDEAPREASGPDGRPKVGKPIDRAGRPAITAALIETFNPDKMAREQAKDDYNSMTPATSAAFAGTVKSSLAILDSLDGTCGTQLLAGEGPDRYATLASVLLDDQLYVNSSSGTCGTYLGAEGEFVGALEPGEGGCGGRTPFDDVIERSYSVLAAGTLTGIDDTITSDGAGHSVDTFPFLAVAN